MGQAVALLFAFTGIHTRKDTDTGPFSDANTYPNIAARTFIAAMQTLTIFGTVQRNIIFSIQTEIFSRLQLAALYPNIPGP
ncbi:Filamentous hemagglutinin family outer membrane protein, partial [Yersinia frederiksenii ATCC 33641]